MRFRALALALLLLLPAGAHSESPRSTLQAAMIARKAGDDREYLRLIQEVASAAPYHPYVLDHLARAFARNGNAAGTAATLLRLAKISVLPELDADFDRVRTSPEFADALSALNSVRAKRVANGTVAFTLPRRDLLPEAVAYDPAGKSFFVSSIRTRQVLRVRDGVAAAFSPKLDYAPTGIAYDSARRLLWVATAAFDRMEGYDASMEDKAALLALDRDGKIVRRIETHGFLDSVAVTPKGEVIVSNATGFVSRVDGDALVTLIRPGVMRSPQGIAPTPDGQTVFIADYAGAIRRVDLRTGDSVLLKHPDEWMMYGIDGLAYANGSLIAIMNGVEPPRVVRFRVSPDGTTLTSYDILEMNTPYLDEPTNGTFADGQFYFVAASQGHRFDAGATPKAEELIDSVILRLRP